LFLRIQLVLPPFLFRLFHHPSVGDEKSTFPPGEGKGAATPVA
jgi:hypothetical protein